MNPASGNRFLARGQRPRIAVFTSARFPHPSEMPLLLRFRDLAKQLGAEVRYFHCSVPDELADSTDIQGLLSRSMISPINDLQAQADIEHFEHTEPNATEEVMHAMATALDCTVEAARHHFATGLGFSLARLAKAWDPDLLVSYYHFEGSAAASICHALLSRPRLMIADGVPGEAQLSRLWPFHVAHSNLLLLGAGAADLRNQAEQISPGIEVLSTDTDRIAERVEALLQRTRSHAPTTTSSAAFRTADAANEPFAARPFLVLGAERTGSNMLVGMLESHPQLTSHGELFNPQLIEADEIDGRLPDGVDKAALLDLRRADPGAFHREMVRLAAEGGSSMVGFKLLYYHGLINNRLIDHLTAIEDLRVIHLKRRDRLARWVSHVRALETDSWYSARSDRKRRPAEPHKVELSLGDTLQDFLYQELQEERGDATFCHTHVLNITYEELAADPAAVGNRVLEFLGVEPFQLVTRSRKTGDRDPRNLIANWATLAPALHRAVPNPVQTTTTPGNPPDQPRAVPNPVQTTTTPGNPPDQPRD